jgi:MYXO-CTERM domain-containing protein
VAQAGSQVSFTFTNVGLAASAITDIYFDDRGGTLSGSMVITSSEMSGPTPVSFKEFATPANLPGGGGLSPAFQTTAGFSSESTNPHVRNGVGNTSGGEEWVSLTFNLALDFAAVLAALDNGNLRVGLHVQGFAGGGSESFINGRGEQPLGEDPPPPIIPLPATGGLGLAGLAAIGAYRRRR